MSKSKAAKAPIALPCRLAAPLGVCCVVGMGLALNGGLSLLSRAYGPACDGILEATVVLADGTAVRCRC
jgi:FAD/FMN-containing dehydrogenase